ncbi:uncharacterized protein [Amphiura filiformis]|uniref:uncharacterized protein n=1 Tax=Amphiura filiformis TaxID=82378 RepID=UPI003B21398F
MAAPTGKAASNLRKRSYGKIEAFTLHQISWQYTNYMKKKKEYEQVKKVDNEAKEPQFKFDMTEILVVDECSMVPITVFSNVLHALLYQGKLKKLVLLGDYRQLPSVEPGNLLSDLYKVFKQYGWSIELTQNHRSESELIVNNATEISSQRMPVFDETKGFQLVELPENDGFDNVQYLHQVVQNLYDSDESIKDHKRSQFVAFRKADCCLINDWCCPLYAGHKPVDSKQKYVFQTGDKICPTRNANVQDYLEEENKQDSATGLSTSLQQNNAATPNMHSNTVNVGQSSNQEAVDEAADSNDKNVGQSSDQQTVDEAAEIAFLEQFCSQNPASPFPEEGKQMDGSLLNKTGDDGEKKEKANEKRICNGEIYFIEHVHEIQEPGKKKDERVTMSDGDTDEKARQSLCAPLRELKLKASIRHAWARTIHTYQGSESETVIYLLGNSGAQNWQHVYTAITRGKTQVYIIGTKSQLLQAIRRDARIRNTELKEMLMEEIIPKLKQLQQQGSYQVCTQQQGPTQACTQRLRPNPAYTQGPTQACTQRLGSNQAYTQQQGPTQACTQRLRPNPAYTQGPTQACTQQLGSNQAYTQQQRPTQACTQRLGPNQAYTQQQGPTQACTQQLGSYQACTQQQGSRTNCGSQMYNSSPRKSVSSSQVHNSTLSRPNPKSQTNRLVNNTVCNTALGGQVGGRASFQNGTSPQPGAKSIFFQPLMTSTQVAPSNSQINSTQGQWKRKPLFSSPKKSFTSIKDRPKSSPTKESSNTPLNGNGIVHSTPKPSSCADYLPQDKDYDDWSNEWSPEQLQQVIDMETTALASQLDRTTPPLYDERATPPLYDGDELNADQTPPESGFKSPPPTRQLMPTVVSPFTPKSSARLSQSWAVKSPAKNIVAKRLYKDMKESPITDGLPNKKRNDLSDSDLF